MHDVATLKYRGLMLEKFIVRALNEGIKIEEIRRINSREALFLAKEADAHALMVLAERFSMNITWVSHSPSSIAKRTAKRRWALVPALVLCLAMVFAFSERIWLIEFKLDETSTETLEPQSGGQALLEGLGSLGIKPGISHKDIRPDDLAMALQQIVPEYAFIGIRQTGVRLLVEAVRELPAPELYDISGERDLVAVADGVISHINVRAGKAAVKVGDTVRRGQVLIRGEERLTGEVTHGICALGEVVARSWLTGMAEAPTTVSKRTYTGRESQESELRLMDFFYPLVQGEWYAQEEVVRRRLPVGGLFLPLSVVSTFHMEYEETYEMGSLPEIQEKISQTALENAFAKRPEACTVIDKWIDYSMIEEDIIRARAVVEIERNIAVARNALYRDQ